MVIKSKTIFGGKLFISLFENKDILVTFQADSGWFSSNSLDNLLKTKKLEGYQIFYLWDEDLDWVKKELKYASHNQNTSWQI
jgi:hypothetical protein